METQLMGGEMYAKHNLTLAKNNQRIFVDYQRSDGRLPGMISYKRDSVRGYYGWFPGLCFLMPALEVYYWLTGILLALG